MPGTTVIPCSLDWILQDLVCPVYILHPFIGDWTGIRVGMVFARESLIGGFNNLRFCVTSYLKNSVWISHHSLNNTLLRYRSLSGVCTISQVFLHSNPRPVWSTYHSPEQITRVAPSAPAKIDGVSLLTSTKHAIINPASGGKPSFLSSPGAFPLALGFLLSTEKRM